MNVVEEKAAWNKQLLYVCIQEIRIENLFSFSTCQVVWINPAHARRFQISQLSYCLFAAERVHQ